MKRILMIAVFWIGLVSNPSAAEDPDIVATQWFDHFTFGLPNTIIGTLYGGTGVIYNRIFRPSTITAPKLRLDHTGQQVVIEGSGWIGNPQNSGLFQFTQSQSSSDKHEAGHGKMSGIFGPLHHLIQGTDYLIEGYKAADWAESLAEANGDLGKILKNSRPIELRLEMIDRNGKSLGRLGTNFVVLERASKIPLSGEDDRTSINQAVLRNRYLAFGAALSTDATGCKSGQTGVVLDAALFNRQFQTQWMAITDSLRLLLDSNQDAGKLVVDVEHRRIDITALSHRIGFGVEIEPLQGVSVQAGLRGGYALQGIWSKQIGTAAAAEMNPGFMLSGGAGNWVNVRFNDITEIYGENFKEWGTGGGYERRSTTLGLRSPLLFTARTFSSLEGKDQCNEFMLGCNAVGYQGKPVKMYGGVSHTVTTEKGDNPNGGQGSLKIKMTQFHVGGRF